jgi:short-subunit dehydrogenase
MYNLNMITLAYFTKVFARDMKSRNFGRILNIGSTGSFQPGPFMAGYCATKAFVLSLSQAVNYELKDTNVRVSTL